MSEKQKGLYNKYIINKADGSPMDPDAKYFVLRVDGDDAHAQASRVALREYALQIFKTMPELAQDVLELINCRECLHLAHPGKNCTLKVWERGKDGLDFVGECGCKG